MLSNLKYFDGAKPGLKRKTNPTAEDVKSKSKKYEQNRPERKLNEKWKIGRSWLVFSDNDTMKCSICISYFEGKVSDPSNLRGNNTFITGCTNRKISAVTDHENSKSHLKADSYYKSKSSSCEEVLHSPAGHALMSMKSAERHRLAYLFRNIHAVAKNNRPLTDYTWLCKVDKAKGLDLGDTYLNEKAALDFLSAISGTTTDKTLSILKEAPFFSFLMDGSTDIAGDEQESLYVRSAAKGRIIERFLCIGSPKSTCSADLQVFVMEALDGYGIDKGKLVGMGSDGASNMVGSKTGLATLLRQDVNPEMVNIHCLCHRLELSFRDVVKGSKLYDKLMTLLVGLHYFYKKQYKNKKGLLSAMDASSVKGVLPPRVTGTRWLPHLTQGITSLLKTFKAYEMHLSTASHENPKAEGFYKMLTDRNLITFAIFLKDTLDPLMKLSLRLQKDDITLADSLFWIDTTASLIDDSFARNSDQLTEVLETGAVAGVTLKGQRPEMAYRETMVKGFSEALRSRFQLNSPEKSVVDATRVLSTKHWPVDDDAVFRDFGCEEIKLVVSHYTETLSRADRCFDPEEALSEWQLLKKALTKRYGTSLAKKSWANIYDEVIDEELCMIMLVIHLLLSLPPTSVSCETSFSQMKLVKTNRRTRLQAKTLNDLMVVKLQSPGIDKFNPDEGIDKWLTTSAKPRKPGYRRTKAASKSEAAEAECISDTEDFDDEEDFEDAIDYINELCGGKDGDDTENKYEDLMSEICFN